MMTQDVNAAIEGAFDAGADEVLVNDSHARMTNILIEELDPRATLLSGAQFKPLMMMEGIDSSFDVVFCVGYHAMVGHSQGVLNETWWGREVYELRLNGQPIGELALNAGIAGAYGVPVALVTGDDAIAREAMSLLPHVETVIVKEARERFAAICLPPQQTARLIRAGARRATERVGEITPWTVEMPARFEVEWASTAEAAAAAVVPGSERTGPRTVAYEAEDFLSAFQGLLACLIVGRTASDRTFG